MYYKISNFIITLDRHELLKKYLMQRIKILDGNIINKVI